jgi:tripartite motif-containing protein 71
LRYGWRLRWRINEDVHAIPRTRDGGGDDGRSSAPPDAATEIEASTGTDAAADAAVDGDAAVVLDSAPIDAASLAYSSEFGAGTVMAPQHIAIDPTTQDVYVAGFAGALFKFDATGAYLATYGTSGTGMLVSAVGVAVDSQGNVYVADYGGHALVSFDSQGVYRSTWTAAASTMPFGRVTGVAIDASGTVYVVDDDNSRVVKFDATGAVLGEFSTSLADAGGGLAGSADIALDGAGGFWIPEYYYHFFAHFSASGVLLGQVGMSGDAAPGLFAQPYSIALDPAGDLFMADNLNDDVQVLGAGGQFRVILGAGADGGLPVDASQINPTGIAFGHAGQLYVSDAANNRILVLTSAL